MNTSHDLNSYLSLVFPLFTPADHAALLHHYPSLSLNITLPKSPSPGLSPPTALDTSATASGLQQTANLIYAESTFICPSHWLAAAYSTHPGGTGYKAQSSTPVALHGIDDTAIFGNRPLPIYSRAYIRAVQRIWGAFITTGNPSIQDPPAPDADTHPGLHDWPAYRLGDAKMVNFNQTGGVVQPVDKTINPQLAQVDAVWAVEPGLQNDFRVVDGWEWEAGRGARCEFWRGVAGRVPM